MLHTKFRGNRSTDSGEDLSIKTWRPSWSCDPDAMNKLLYPLPMKDPHKIWL